MADLPATRLRDLEQTIERGLQTFVEVGRALREIRDSKLYQEKYGTFAAYVEQRWAMKRAHAYYLMEAGQVADEVSDMSDIAPPENARQVHELARLPTPEIRAQAWVEAKAQETPERPITAKQVREVVNRHLEVQSPAPTPVEAIVIPPATLTEAQKAFYAGGKVTHLTQYPSAEVAAECLAAGGLMHLRLAAPLWRQAGEWYLAVAQEMEALRQQPLRAVGEE